MWGGPGWRRARIQIATPARRIGSRRHLRRPFPIARLPLCELALTLLTPRAGVAAVTIIDVSLAFRGARTRCTAMHPATALSSNRAVVARRSLAVASITGAG